MISAHFDNSFKSLKVAVIGSNCLENSRTVHATAGCAQLPMEAL